MEPCLGLPTRRWRRPCGRPPEGPAPTPPPPHTHTQTLLGPADEEADDEPCSCSNWCRFCASSSCGGEEGGKDKGDRQGGSIEGERQGRSYADLHLLTEEGGRRGDRPLALAHTKLSCRRGPIVHRLHEGGPHTLFHGCDDLPSTLPPPLHPHAPAVRTGCPGLPPAPPWPRWPQAP